MKKPYDLLTVIKNPPNKNIKVKSLGLPLNEPSSK
jgi:hypothetical protein